MRRFAPLLPLPFIVAFAAWGSARAADSWGGTLVAALAAVAPILGAQPAASTDAELESAGAIPVSVVLLPDTLAAPSKGSSPKRGKPRSAAPADVRGIYVSARTVLRLADGRVMPRGLRVPADGNRPAGLRLVGVEGLGIGLREGDVLTRALGQPATASSAVVRAILVARANRVKVLEGEFYRGRERFTIRVEQPYLDDGSGSLTGPGSGPKLPAP